MQKPNENEQWLLEGNCIKCRRKEYCSKPCTKYNRATEAMVNSLVSSKLNEMTGGAYEKIMSHSKY